MILAGYHLKPRNGCAFGYDFIATKGGHTYFAILGVRGKHGVEYIHSLPHPHRKNSGELTIFDLDTQEIVDFKYLSTTEKSSLYYG